MVTSLSANFYANRNTQFSPKSDRQIAKLFRVQKDNVSFPSRIYPENTRFLKGVSFGSFNFVASPEHEKNLNCKIQLTPEKIDNIIRTASSREHGIMETYSQFMNIERPKISGAIQSMASILEEFDKKAAVRLTQISRMDPPLSNIPFLGAFAQSIQVATGSHMATMKSHAVDIMYAWKDTLTGKYFFDGLSPIKRDFCASGRHMISYLDKNHPKHNKILGHTNNAIQIVDKSYDGLYDETNNLLKRLDDAGIKILDGQNIRQGTRAVIKTLSVGLLDGAFEVAQTHGLINHDNLNKIARLAVKELEHRHL